MVVIRAIPSNFEGGFRNGEERMRPGGADLILSKLSLCPAFCLNGDMRFVIMSKLRLTFGPKKKQVKYRYLWKSFFGLFLGPKESFTSKTRENIDSFRRFIEKIQSVFKPRSEALTTGKGSQNYHRVVTEILFLILYFNMFAREKYLPIHHHYRLICPVTYFK